MRHPLTEDFPHMLQWNTKLTAILAVTALTVIASQLANFTWHALNFTW